MLWAASCIAFSGFLRAGELTAPSKASFDPEVHLCHSDMSQDGPSNAAAIQDGSLPSGYQHFYWCRFVPSMGTAWLSIEGETPGPLFQFSDGRYLTRQRFVEEIYSTLQLTGIYQYCSHSFWIGAATTVAAKGVEDSVIQTLVSLAYLQYVRIPRQQLAGYSKLLCS